MQVYTLSIACVFITLTYMFLILQLLLLSLQLLLLMAMQNAADLSESIYCMLIPVVPLREMTLV